MTSSIFKDLCAAGSLPDDVLNYYSNIYPAMSILPPGKYSPPTNTCSVVFGK
jgi:hypothetical protein